MDYAVSAGLAALDLPYMVFAVAGAMIMGDTKGAAATALEPAQVKPQESRDPKLLPPYNVVLLDDNDHSYKYVIVMLQRLFRHSLQTAYQMACEVDGAGRVIVDTTTKERAELKRDQIHAYGPDPLIERCAGSMSAVIEPCPGQ